MTAVEQLSRLLADRSLVDDVLGDHPSNDPSLPPAETFLVHGCGLLAETLALREKVRTTTFEKGFIATKKTDKAKCGIPFSER